MRVHFELCTEANGVEGCKPNEDEEQGQYILIFAVPNGTSSPASITAAPVLGGAPIEYARNDQAAQSLSEAFKESGGEWPPAGSEGVGYVSAVFTEEKGEKREWVVDADFGLPVPADGSPFAGPFPLQMAFGWRNVSEGAPASRPVDCFTPAVDVPDPEQHAFCFPNEEEPKSLGTSDLKIGVPAQASAFVGGKATLSFPLDFASTASGLPSFNLTAGSTLPQAGLSVSDPSFTPATPDATTHRSPLDSRAITVTVPKTAKPGVYDVTLTVTAFQGGSVSQVARLRVTKPTLKLGGVKLNKRKGTATLAVKVPSAGTLTASGKGLVKAKRTAKKAKTLKITIKAKGATKALLEETGKARVKAKISFKPSSGIAVKKTKAILLKQN